MQQSWRPSFATDYQDRGSYNPYQAPYFQPPSQPNYNRSPAPFMSSCQTQESFQGFPAQHQQPETYQQQHYYQQNSYEPQIPYDPYMQQAQNAFSRQVTDKREQPEMDEDFPSYNELRSVFLQKQKQAEDEAKRAYTLPLRRSTQSNVSRKPPPLPRKPDQRSQHGNTSFQQTSTSTFKPSTQSMNDYIDSRRQVTTQYREIPVQHQPQMTSRQQTHTWTTNSVPRQELGYRPPMTINVTPSAVASYDEPSPRVKITSNSPMSPQRAMYRPDGEEGFIIARPRRHSVTIAPGLASMSSSSNQPRRRTSYAEIMITGSSNSLPRNFTTSPGVIQRSFSQIVTNQSSDGQEDQENEIYPSFTELKQQFRQRERNNMTNSYSSPFQGFGTTFNLQPRQQAQSQDGFTRITMRKSAGVEPNMAQRDGGWSATVQSRNPHMQPTISVGPNVQYSSHPGRSAAHLQYNSPMGLYSTRNAQEALDKDPEASKLLKITGSQSKGPIIQISPTLQAVLKEDFIKKRTGHDPDVGYYQNHREYGPGIGPLRQYEEIPDTLCQNITSYNQQQDKSLHYATWNQTA